MAHPDTPGARPFLCCPCGSSLFTRQQNKPSTAKQKQKGPKTHKTKTCTCLVSLCLSVEKPRHSEKNKQNAWYGVIPQVSTTGKGSKKRSQNENACSQSVRQFVVVGVVPPLARAGPVRFCGSARWCCVCWWSAMPSCRHCRGAVVVPVLSQWGAESALGHEVFLGSGRFSHHMFPNVTGGATRRVVFGPLQLPRARRFGTDPAPVRAPGRCNRPQAFRPQTPAL